MCGLVGIINPWTNGFRQDEVDMFRDMLFFDTLRGWDSTGTCLVRNNQNVTILKDALMGPTYIRQPEVRTLFGDAYRQGKALMGHNRAATKGSVTPANAHPFCIDDKVVLMQNGTYFGSHKGLKDTEVDTEAIAHVIAEEDDIEKALQRINSAYALAWYNVPDETIYLIRNEHRPLWTVELASGTFAYASESETLMHAAYRNKQKMKGYPESLEPGTLMSIKLNRDKSVGILKKKIDINYRYVPKSSDTKESREFDLALWNEGFRRHAFHPTWSIDEQTGEIITNDDNDPPVTDADAQKALEETKQVIKNIVQAANEEKQEKQTDIFKLISENNFSDWSMKAANKKWWFTFLAEKHASRTPVPVELTEAYPIYTDRDANKKNDWYMCGCVVLPDASLGSPVVHWLIRNKTAKEVDDMLDLANYQALLIGAPIVHNVLGEDKKHYEVISHPMHNLVPCFNQVNVVQ